MGSHEMWFAALLLLSPARALATPSCESRATGPGEVPGNNVDEDGDGCAACYLDADRDGYGAGLIQIELRRLGAAPCTLRLGCPSGSPCPVPKGGDCMPDDAAVHPHQAQDATHGPFGRDVDCDAATPFWGYADQDGDTSPGTLSVGAGGERPDDCDDDDPLVHPDAAEASATDADDDCDGVAMCQRDHDDDGYGAGRDEPRSGASCSTSSPDHWVARATVDDCDDGDSAIHPSAPDAAPGVDRDCDGHATCYCDVDGDGQAGTARQVTVPAGGPCAESTSACRASAATDCDDDDPAVQTLGGACMAPCFPDADVDGAGARGATPTPQVLVNGACPLGFAEDDDDCDDGDPSVHPGAAELPGDGLDNDCDGAMACLVDADGDGVPPPDAAVALAASCPATADGRDCDDADPEVHPGAVERANGRDDDCDGRISLLDEVDCDGDGRVPGHAWDRPCVEDRELTCGGVPITLVCQGEAWQVVIPPGEAWAGAAGTLGAGDCDEGDARRHAGADEVCDGGDTSCSGQVPDDGSAPGLPIPYQARVPGMVLTLEADLDEDGVVRCAVGEPLGADARVARPDGRPAPSAAEGDCDDRCAIVHPGQEADTMAYTAHPADCDEAPVPVDDDGDGLGVCDTAELLYVVVVDDGRRVAPVVEPAAGPCEAGLADALGPLTFVDGTPDEASRDLLAGWCAAGEREGRPLACYVIRVAFEQDRSVGGALADGPPGACRPEELTRPARWSVDRVAGARATTMWFDAQRAAGLPVSRAPVDLTGALPRMDARLLTPFAPAPGPRGLLLGCWEDPATWPPQVIRVAGFDCDDRDDRAGMDRPEGEDLLSRAMGRAADGRECVDGIDNDCDGLADCDDPGCRSSFEGLGVCPGAGCGCDHGAPPSALGVALLVLLVLLARRRAALALLSLPAAAAEPGPLSLTVLPFQDEAPRCATDVDDCVEEVRWSDDALKRPEARQAIERVAQGVAYAVPGDAWRASLLDVARPGDLTAVTFDVPPLTGEGGVFPRLTVAREGAQEAWTILDGAFQEDIPATWHLSRWQLDEARTFFQEMSPYEHLLEEADCGQLPTSLRAACLAGSDPLRPDRPVPERLRQFAEACERLGGAGSADDRATCLAGLPARSVTAREPTPPEVYAAWRDSTTRDDLCAREEAAPSHRHLSDAFVAARFAPDATPLERAHAMWDRALTYLQAQLLSTASEETIDEHMQVLAVLASWRATGPAAPQRDPGWIQPSLPQDDEDRVTPSEVVARLGSGERYSAVVSLLGLDDRKVLARVLGPAWTAAPRATPGATSPSSPSCALAASVIARFRPELTRREADQRAPVARADLDWTRELARSCDLGSAPPDDGSLCGAADEACWSAKARGLASAWSLASLDAFFTVPPAASDGALRSPAARWLASEGLTSTPRGETALLRALVTAVLDQDDAAPVPATPWDGPWCDGRSTTRRELELLDAMVLDDAAARVRAQNLPATPDRIVDRVSRAWTDNLKEIDGAPGLLDRPARDRVRPMAVCDMKGGPAETVRSIDVSLVLSIRPDLLPGAEPESVVRAVREADQRAPFFWVGDPTTTATVTPLASLPDGGGLVRVTWRVMSGWQLFWGDGPDGGVAPWVGAPCSDLALAPDALVPTLVRAALLTDPDERVPTAGKLALLEQEAVLQESPVDVKPALDGVARAVSVRFETPLLALRDPIARRLQGDGRSALVVVDVDRGAILPARSARPYHVVRAAPDDPPADVLRAAAWARAATGMLSPALPTRRDGTGWKPRVTQTPYVELDLDASPLVDRAGGGRPFDTRLGVGLDAVDTFWLTDHRVGVEVGGAGRVEVVPAGPIGPDGPTRTWVTQPLVGAVLGLRFAPPPRLGDRWYTGALAPGLATNLGARAGLLLGPTWGGTLIAGTFETWATFGVRSPHALPLTRLRPLALLGPVLRAEVQRAPTTARVGVQFDIGLRLSFDAGRWRPAASLAEPVARAAR